MVSVPLRAAPALASTLYSTVPLPVPAAPLAIVIHGAVLTAVHEQPEAAVTLTLPPAAEAGTDCDVGESEYEQPLP